MNCESRILPLQRQYEICDAVRLERLNTVLPAAMEKAGIDMWLILSGEYNEDPIFYTLVPQIIPNASRMTCIAFAREADGTLGRYSINKPNRELNRFFTQLPYSNDGQWDEIAAFVREKAPRRIGVNISDCCAIGAGLSKALYDELCAHLGEYADRLVSADTLSVLWLEQRTDAEMAMYPAVYDVTTEVMSRAFSREVLTPGVTTTDELEWWCAQRFAEKGLPLCFRPTINFQREGCGNTMMTGVVRCGDLLHYDAGIQYLGLCTDLQRLAYVCRPGEADAPQGIRRGFEQGHTFARLAAQEFIAGRTGNEIFHAAKAAAQKAGIEAMLYTHPIGLHCHAAGPTIGLYDKQESIPLRGERVLHPHTAYALEFNVTEAVPEWGGQKVVFYLEETVLFCENGKVQYLDDQWNRLILIGAPDRKV